MLIACIRAVGAIFVRYDTCAYGKANKKPQQLAGTLPGLLELGRRCVCAAVPHEILCGKVRVDGRWFWKTDRKSVV